MSSQRPGSGYQATTLFDRQVRVWGGVLLAWGVIHMIGSPALSPSWGFIFLLMGATAWVLPEPSLFVAYGIVLAWAAIVNLLAWQALAVVNTVVQVFLAVAAWRIYRRQRHESACAEALEATRMARAVPPWALVLSLASLGGSLGLLLLGYLLLGVAGGTGLPRTFNTALQGLSDLGAPAMGLGAAALADGTPRRSLASAAVAFSAVVLLGQIAFGLVPLIE